MALSEHERRQLDGLERLLEADDPLFVQSFRRERVPARQIRVAAAVGTVAVMFLIVILGIGLKVIPLGVLGFVLMIVVGLTFPPLEKSHVVGVRGPRPMSGAA